VSEYADFNCLYQTALVSDLDNRFVGLWKVYQMTGSELERNLLTYKDLEQTDSVSFLPTIVISSDRNSL